MGPPHRFFAPLPGRICRLAPARNGDSPCSRALRGNGGARGFLDRQIFADLIRACGLLTEGGKPLQCEIIGEGPLENELRAQIEQLDLQNRAALSGAKPQREVRQHFAAASVFVLPSVVDPEGGIDNLPTVIMEAMATGLPVISTNIGGIPEMVVENETGFLVQPGDAAALAGAIEKLINDRPLAQRLGQAGYSRAQRLF